MRDGQCEQRRVIARTTIDEMSTMKQEHVLACSRRVQYILPISIGENSKVAEMGSLDDDYETNKHTLKSIIAKPTAVMDTFILPILGHKAYAYLQVYSVTVKDSPD